MPQSPTGPLGLFPFGSLPGEEALSRPQSPFSDSHSDSCLPFEPEDPHQPWPHDAVRLQDPYLRCNRDLGWNIDWAVAFVVDRLEQNWADAAAPLRDIRIQAAALYANGLGQEIPFHIFDRLDRVLFAGHLKNAVFLDIGSLSRSVSGATCTHRWGPNPDVKRISILLNDHVLRDGQPRDILATLIHHMIHAYFLVACGGQKEDEVSYGRLAHNVHFGKIMQTIKRLSAAHAKELTSLDYRYRPPSMQYTVDEQYDSWRRDAPGREDRSAWYRSHCHCNVRGPSEAEVDDWYKKVCKSMFHQPHSVRKLEVQVYNYRRHELEKKRRAHLVPSAKSVEFVFREKPVLVPTKEIEQFRSIIRAFNRAGSRFAKVHKDVSEDTLVRFVEFLHTGSYRPDPRSFASAAVSPSLNAARKSPPIIEPQNIYTEAGVVVVDVQFAKLSILMGFEDCKRYALDRMNSYGIVCEDPVAILKEIYRGRELDSDLRSWARTFLTRIPATSSHARHHSNLLDHSVGLPNLLKLESQRSPYRSRFLDAVDSNEALENDVNTARAELQVRGWYTSRRLPVDRPRSLSAHRHHAPHSSFLLDSPSLSPSSSSWRSVHSLTRHLSSLHVDRTCDMERHPPRNPPRNHDCIEASHGNIEVRRSFREQEQRQRDVDYELERAKEKVRRLEKKKRESRETQTEVKVQAVALVEEFLERGLIGRREDVDEY